MKRVIILIFLLIYMTGFSGCTKGVESCPVAENTPQVEEASAEEESKEMISSDMLGQGIYDALAKEWDAWNAKSEEQKLFSSHFPGHCYKSFDTWAECEDFLGFSVWNPLENSDLKRATYVGLSIGYADAPRFYVNFYGPNAEQAEWIDVQSGYRDGDVRITVNAEIRVDVREEGRLQEPLITEDSGERYVATTAVVVRGPVTYSIRIIGEKNQWDEVRNTLEKVLPYFEEE